MARTRKTLDRSQVVTTANKMIAHLAQDGTKEACDKREAIIAVVSQILLDGNAYNGFRYLEAPIEGMGGKSYDGSRIAFYG